jgi:hypothetical protein
MNPQRPMTQAPTPEGVRSAEVMPDETPRRVETPLIDPEIEVQPSTGEKPTPGEEITSLPTPPREAEVPVVTPDSNHIQQKAAVEVVEGTMPRYNELKKRADTGQLDAADIVAGYIEMDQKDIEALGIKED